MAATRCGEQTSCWEHASRCDLAELGLPHRTEACDHVASYCDLRTGTCRATRVEYPKLNPCVDWRTMRSRPECFRSKAIIAATRSGGRRLVVVIVVAVMLIIAVSAAVYFAVAHPWLRTSAQIPDDVLTFLRRHCFPNVALRNLKGDETRTWVTVRVRRQLVACSSVIEYADRFEFTNDCVHPAHRRRGLGTRMHRARLQHCRARAPRKRVEVHVDAGNGPAHGLARAVGALARQPRLSAEGRTVYATARADFVG